MARSYLDHASTSPLRPAARQAMLEALNDPDSGLGADPSRIYDEAIWAREQLESCRDRIAHVLGTTARSVVFTSGATESIVTATRFGRTRGDHIVASAVEHSSAARSAAAGPHTIIAVDAGGSIEPESLAHAIRPDTGLVHLQWANHETGVTQRIETAVEICRDRGALIHVDAAQAIGTVATSIKAINADLVSISAHKFGGPAGIGALIVRKGLRLAPLMVGGDQERARRGGLENLLGAIGFASALEVSDAELEEQRAKHVAYNERIRNWASSFDGVTAVAEPRTTAPHIVCLVIEGVEPQGVLLGLDQRGVSVHSGSACASEDLQPSPVLQAMGIDAHHSLRISMGWSTSDADIDQLLIALPEAITYLRSLAAR